MEAIIGKELLSEVLGINDINLVLDEGNEINYTRYANMTRGSRDVFINKYELAHKCKEWAYNQGYSYIGNNKLVNIYSKDTKIIMLVNPIILNWFDINIDFIACQWIFDNRQ